MSESGGWSIAIPAGWDVVSQTDGSVALSGTGGIAEVLVSPSWGLSLEELGARTVEDLSAWPGVVDVETELVRLPAGDAVRATIESSTPESEPTIFTLYAMDDEAGHYAISVRGLRGGADWAAVANAIAESFAIHD